LLRTNTITDFSYTFNKLFVLRYPSQPLQYSYLIYYSYNLIASYVIKIIFQLEKNENWILLWLYMDNLDTKTKEINIYVATIQLMQLHCMQMNGFIPLTHLQQMLKLEYLRLISTSLICLHCVVALGQVDYELLILIINQGQICHCFRFTVTVSQKPLFYF
jgi:hypothetical protein